MDYKLLIKQDIEKIRENANFNAEQSAVFEELIKADYHVYINDTTIYTRLGMSERKFYKVKSEIKKKIERIL